MMFNWQQRGWPKATVNKAALRDELDAFKIALRDAKRFLGKPQEPEAVARALAQEAVKTSAIEGVNVDESVVMSSICKVLGVAYAPKGFTKDARAEGVAQMVLAVRKDWKKPLSEALLKRWHGALLEVPIEYGSLPVRLPDHPGVELRLVAVKWPGSEKPMMLLTTLRAARSRRSLQQVVEGCLTRWRVEETIRFVKQAYEVEDVRLLRYDRLKAMVAIVLAVAYFAMVWLGLREKLAVLADHVKRVSKRMFEVPEDSCQLELAL